MLKAILNFIIILFGFSVTAQNFSAKIIDKGSQFPIPYAAVQTEQYKGVITNEDGLFFIDLENNSIKTITISCLGYETLILSIDEIKRNDFVINLEPSITELSTVYLNNTKPNVDSIIAKVVANLNTNYKTEDIRHELFYRETTYMDFNNLDFEVKKASHVKKKKLQDANNRLKEMTQDIMSSNIIHFTDFKGVLSNLDDDQSKLYVEKATQIINSKKDFSLENIQVKAQDIVLNYLDTTLTYKLKSGLFKIEDSLSLANNNNAKDEKDEFEIKDLKENAQEILEDSRPNPQSLLRTILNSEYYKYALQDIIYHNNEMIYLIRFDPRRAKAKYTGILYITNDSYAILKTDYQYSEGKRGSKFNLRLILGVKYIENISKGTILYKRNENDWYEPRYIKHETGQYFYVNRPLKFIENSRNKNKVQFNFKIEGEIKQKTELLFTDTIVITQEIFDSINEQKITPFKRQRKYDANVWGTSEILIPTEELKTFDASDN